MPLPCTRELWEPVSDQEWERRYATEYTLASKEMHAVAGLNLGDLIAPRGRLGQVGGSGAGERERELARWCEGVDEFGALLWMATMLERS